MTLPIAVQARTDIGRMHHRNEDAFAVSRGPDGGLLLLVCDGMGGMGRGDEASSLGVDVIVDHVQQADAPPLARLADGIRRADLAIRRALCAKGPGRPGCTAAGAYVSGGRAWVAWVGDSRVYHVRDGRVIERTRDHKLVESLVAAGELSPDEARTSALSSVLTKALGGRSPSEAPVDVSVLEEPWVLRPGDRLLVASDGLIDLVPDDEVPELLDAPPDAAADACVATALARGGHDNITVIVAEWLSDDDHAHYPDQRSPPVRDPLRVLSLPEVDDEDDPSSGAAVRALLDDDLFEPDEVPTAPVARPSFADVAEVPDDEPLPWTVLVMAVLLGASIAWSGVQLLRHAMDTASPPAGAALHESRDASGR